MNLPPGQKAWAIDIRSQKERPSKNCRPKNILSQKDPPQEIHVKKIKA